MGVFPLSGSPDLASRINDYAWDRTPLGPIDRWPPSHRIALNMILGSRFPMQLLWGPEHIHFYNDAYIPIAANKHPEALGRPGAAVWPEIWAQVLPMLEQVQTTGAPTWSDDQLLVLNRRGFLEECYFTYSYGPVRDDTGAVEGISVAVSETTRRVLEERRLRTVHALGSSLGGLSGEAALFQSVAAILGQNPADLPFALFYLLDRARRNLYLVCAVGLTPGHPAAVAEVRLAEHAGEQLWPFTDILKGNAPVLVSDQLRALAPLPGGPWDAPATSALAIPLRPGGRSEPIGCLIAGLSPRLQLDAGYIAFLERVAGHVAAHISGLRAYAIANEAVRLRDDFLSVAAHELKNPLTPLIGKLQLLRRRLEREGVAQRYLDDVEMVAFEAGRLVGMIDSLLDLSRLRGGQLSIARGPVDLGKVAGEVVAEIQPTLHLHTFELTVPDAPALVAGDALRLAQVVRNLISNAVKYSPQGGPVSVEVARQAPVATLSVRDEGVGIPSAVLPQIFERYYRAEGASTAAIGGLGVGLFVVHELVRLHGGQVSVESAPTRGSRFTVTLPLL